LLIELNSWSYTIAAWFKGRKKKLQKFDLKINLTSNNLEWKNLGIKKPPEFRRLKTRQAGYRRNVTFHIKLCPVKLLFKITVTVVTPDDDNFTTNG
jgi:hypothetical protein